MPLQLHMHPFASYCQKVLIAFYENDTPFEPVLVDLGDPTSRARFKALWPMTKMPVLRDDARDLTIPESTIIIEYIDHHHPGAVRFIPDDPAIAWRTRLHDRFYDNYVQQPMQKIVGDRLRPADQRDAFGVAEARTQLRGAYDFLARELAGRTWATGPDFGLADCAAAPALFYADLVEPLGPAHRNVADYLARLRERPSFARVIAEASPYMPYFPK